MRLFGTYSTSFAWLVLVPNSIRTDLRRCSVTSTPLPTTSAATTSSRLKATISPMASATETSPSQKSDDAKGDSASFSDTAGSGDGSQVGALDARAQETSPPDESAPAEPSVTEAAGVPLLPPPDPNSGDGVPKIKLGDTISFEELGPVIINADGTTRRIDNWDEMSDGERQVAWRRISQRNEERRRKLLLLQQEQEQQPDNHARNDGTN